MEKPIGSGKFEQFVISPCEYDFEELSVKQAPKINKLVTFMEWFFRIHGFDTPGDHFDLTSKP